MSIAIHPDLTGLVQHTSETTPSDGLSFGNNTNAFMKKKTRDKKQPAGRLAVALLVLIALVFMLLGPKAKADDIGRPFNQSSGLHTCIPAAI